MGSFSRSDKLQVAIFLFSLVPFAATVFLGYAAGNALVVVLSTGLAIGTAGFALAWGTESLQFVVSQVLAIAVLAIVQVVPEYSVEVVLAYRGATDPTLLSFATAAMTGANRLLLGLGWPMVYVLSRIAARRSSGKGGDVVLERQQAVGVLFLGIATLYSFVVVLRANLGPFDAAVLLGIFAVYLYVGQRLPPHDAGRMDELEGPTLAIARLRPRPKILAIAALILVGAIVVGFGSEPFVRNFLSMASSVNLNEYLLLQWLTPVLTELPEATTVFYWAARTGKGPLALANLISSKLNQWTMLVSTIPIVYAVALGSLQGIALTTLQVDELFLTSAQSLYGFVCLMDLRLSAREAAQLFALFAFQLFIPQLRFEVAVLYLILAGVELALARGKMPLLGEMASLLKGQIH